MSARRRSSPAPATDAERYAAPALARALAVAAAVVTLAYLLPFRAYALQVEDEGTLLYQMKRVIDGQVPYLDFATGYTPGYFYLTAALLSWAGDVPGLRTALACVHAAVVAGLVLLIARVARPIFALLVPFLYLAFIPVYPGEFCAFNVPYPAWFSTAGSVATALAMVWFVERRRRSSLALAGVAAAVTFAMKPNAGLFAIAASVTVLLLVGDASLNEQRGGRAARALWIVLWTGVLAGAALTLGRPQLVDALLYLAPLAAAMLVLLPRARAARARLVGDTLVLLASFAAGSLPWLAFFAARLGRERFLSDVLFIGSSAAQLYYTPPAPIEPWALLVTAYVAAIAVAGAAAGRGRVPAVPAAVVLVLAGAAGAVAIARIGVMPERFTWSVIRQLESASLALVVGVEVAGIAWLWRRSARAARAGAGASGGVAATLLIFGLFMEIQLYPRADFMHLVTAAPLIGVFAAFLLERVCRWWELGLARSDARRLPRLPAPVFAAALVAMIVVRVTPAAAILASESRFVLPFAAAPLWVEAEHAADLRGLGATATLLRERAGSGAPSLGFPALDVALFLSGARNPTPFAYFFAGRPDHEEEAAIVDTLATRPPPALASLNREFKFFDAAPAYYFLLRRFVRARYRLLGRFERYDVLGAASGPAVAATAASAATAGVAAATDDVAAATEGMGAVTDTGAATAGVAAATDGVNAAPAATDRASGAVAAGRDAAGAVASDRGTTAVERRLDEIRALASAPPSRSAGALLEAASADDATIRAAAIGALLDAVARDPRAGLEEYVARAGLERRRQILILRTIRDTRDPRAASYLFAAAASDDARIVREALGAMAMTRATMIARRYLWAGAEEPAVWPGRAALDAAVARTLGDASAPPRALAFAAELAGPLHATALVPALRARLAGDAAVSASAAAALAHLAPAGLACDLVPLLARGEAELDEIVPTLLVELAGDPVAGAEARACVAQAVARPSAGQPAAIWAAAAIGDPDFVAPLGDVLASGDLHARRAASWALGEIGGDARAATLLERAATESVDATTRALARAAAEKVAGTRPRALTLATAAGGARQADAATRNGDANRVVVAADRGARANGGRGTTAASAAIPAKPSRPEAR